MNYRGAGGASTGGWDGEFVDGSVWRRRRWIRKRTRKRSFKKDDSARCHDFSGAHEKQDPVLVCESMVLIMAFLCSLVRGSKLQESRVSFC